MVLFFYAGLILGATIGLLTMGFRLTHKTSGYMNLGHVVNVGVGMMLGFIVVQQLGLRPIMGTPFAFLLTGIFNAVVYRVFYHRMEKRGYSEALISLFGLVFMYLGVNVITIATYLVCLHFPSEYWCGTSGALIRNHLHYRDPLYEPLGLSLLLIIAGYLFTRTNLGIKLRAVAETPTLAEICGTNSVNIKTLAWFIAGGLAGVAGIVSPYLYKGEFARDIELYYIPVFISGILSEKKEPWVAGIIGILVAYIQLIVVLNGQASFGNWFADFTQPILAIVLAIILYMKDRKISIPVLFNKRD
ncbi:MAG: branched-chain amino acid ABC transporter permease [Candidatus Bathyarchaeota archaeon]|nr:branched-chain amino acid ABC transporter permease [Candidatus Bathyarchaeota archaeon]